LEPLSGELSFSRRLRPGKHVAIVRSKEGEQARLPFSVSELAPSGSLRIVLP
jgi:hypothetical protein